MSGPPPGSRVVVERAGPPLVLRVDPLPGAGHLVLFVVLWNAIAWPVAAGLWDGAGDLRRLTLLPLFPAVGVALAVFWLHWLFARTRVVVEPGRVAVRRACLGIGRTRTVTLGDADRASVEAAFTDPDESRDRVRVGPTGGGVTFGTDLSHADLNRAAKRINEALGVERPEDVGAERLRALAEAADSTGGGDPPADTSPVESRSEPGHPHVITGTDDRGRATVTVSVLPGMTPGKRAAVRFGVGFAVVWWCVVGSSLAEWVAEPLLNGRRIAPLHAIGSGILVLAGTGWVAAFVALCRATITTAIGDGWVEALSGVGGLGITRRARLERIEEVVIWENRGRTPTANGDRRDPAAALRVYDELWPLSYGGGLPVAAAVAGAVRFRLKAAGWTTKNPARLSGADDRDRDRQL